MKKNNRYIQKHADDLLKHILRNLFFLNKNMSLGEHPSKEGEEIGIDFFFEVYNEKPKHISLFLNQNKGTDNLKLIKKKTDINFGKISFQISLRHAEYFYFELEQPLIFTLCDITNQNVYWYDIQNDSSLPDKISNQKKLGKESLQIYIPVENCLNEQTFETLLDRINYAKYNQIWKNGIVTGNIKADYSAIESNLQGQNIIDKILGCINFFEGIIVFPPQIISQLYPFRMGEGTYIREFALFTDNEEFYDFISSLYIENEKIMCSINDEFVVNISDKLKEIVNFFQVNNIHHIYWNGKGKKTKYNFCIHNLFHYEKCDCERCNFDRLDYIKTKELLEITEYTSHYELLRKGYTYFLIGDFINSAKVFFNIYKEAEKTTHPIMYTISKYNLINLRKLIKTSYYKGEHKEEKIKLLQDLELIIFDIDEGFIKQYAPHFIDIYKNIKNLEFYNNVKDSIDECYSDIQRYYFSDKYGGVRSQTKYDELIFTFLRFNSFLEHNFIIFHHYQEYADVSKKILESIFALYSLKHPDAIRYEKFDWTILKMWIFNVETDYSKYLLQKYYIKNIRIDEDLSIVDRINELLSNLIKSSDYLQEFTGFFKPIRLQQILDNITLITNNISVPLQNKELLISKILEFCETENGEKFIPESGIINFAKSNEVIISKQLLKRMLEVMSSVDKYSRYNYSEILGIYLKKCNQKESVSFIKKILKISSFDEINFVTNENTMDKLFSSFPSFGDYEKSIIKLTIEKCLNESFNPELYYNAILFDMVDFDISQFDYFIDTIPDMSSYDNNTLSRTGLDNIRLGQVINIIYKFDLQIDDKFKQLINKSCLKRQNYYKWLMDIDGFDYHNFDPYWIVEYRTIYYFKQFKKSKCLKQEILKTLKDNYSEGVAKIYFESIA